MKKFAVMLMCLAVMCSCAWAAYYDEGNDGDSWETAYVIDSVEDLKMMKYRSDSESGKYYKMTADIDLPSETYWGGLNLSGHFDGQNHTIRLNSTENRVNAGLFYTVSDDDSVIRNLNVTGNVEANCAGTIVHYLAGGLVENCSFTGTVTYNSSGDVLGAGGIIAHMYGGTVRNCRVNADISGRKYAGGIAGELSGGLIENCTTDVRILSGTYRGGIAGNAKGNHFSLSGNTWPNIYPQVGTGNEGDINVLDSQDIASTEWNGHRYQIIDESLTWEEAKSRCESLGGHLATITSHEEQNFIEGLLRDSETEFYGYWLGAKTDQFGWWHWVTDEVFEKQYQNFASGQPDGSGRYLQIFTPDEELSQYALYTLGKWDDTTNDGTGGGYVSQHGFICEWDLEQPDVNPAPLASDFQDWLTHPENWRNDGTESYGALPSPVDLSHLKNNPPRISGATASFVRAAALPVSFDARKEFGLPEARNQGVFNTCWAFASIGAMEANYKAQKMKVLGDNPDLSELHVAWFVYKDPSSDYYSENSVNVLDKKGSAQKSVSFLTKGLAPVNESEMKYSEAGSNAEGSDARISAFVNGRTAKDFGKSHISLNNAIKIGYIDELNQDYSLADVKRLIMEHGAVYFHYYEDEQGHDESKRTFYSKTRRNGNLHAALIVGWDDEFSQFDFGTNNRPSVNGAWLVRNSRGSDWGDNGYFWMSYMQADDVGMLDAHAFIVREESRDTVVNNLPVSEDISQNSDIQQNAIVINEHDEDGKTKDITPQWSAAIFRSLRNENLTRVAFYTTDNNVKYKIFVNNFGKNRPTDPGKAENELMNGEIAYAGYHVIDLTSNVELYEGDYYSVIIKMELESDYEYPTGAEAAIDGYVHSSVNEGESFFAEGEPVPSVWQDGKYIDGGPYDACIKAFTEYRAVNKFPPSITTSSLPDASVEQSYEFHFEASGSAVIEWRAGELPSGFSLNREGVLRGYTYESGEYEINITAFNDVDVAEKVFTMKVVDSDNPNPNPDPDPNPDPAPNPNPNPDPDPNPDPAPNPNPNPNPDPNPNPVQGGKSSGGGCNDGFSILFGVVVLAVCLKRR